MNELTNTIIEALLNGLATVAVVAIGAAVTGIRAWIISKSEQLKLDKTAKEAALITDVAGQAVRFVEHVGANIPSQDKLEEAMRLVLSIMMERHGISADEDEVTTAIESQLNKIKEKENEVYIKKWQ